MLETITGYTLHQGALAVAKIPPQADFETLLESVGWQSGSGEGLFMARERHVQALMQASSHLERAAHSSDKLELFAEELRLAQAILGTITGEFTSDDLLGEIFSRFCIGK